MKTKRNLEAYGIDLAVATAYAEKLEDHLRYVHESAAKLGVPEAQYKIHDASKWSREEFPYYAQHFNGVKSEQSTINFERAWLHHIHHNPHHWDHWVFPTGKGLKGGASVEGAIEMPLNYILEMIADWQGSSMAYTGSYDMTEWLTANLPRIKVHPRTWEVLIELLFDNGYQSLMVKNGFVEITKLMSEKA